jgi:hypothetical protein
MSEGVPKSAEERLSELEMKVDVLNRLPQGLALAPSNCCNSCNNVKAEEVVEGQVR